MESGRYACTDRLKQFLSKLLKRDNRATLAGINRAGHLESPP